MKFKLYLDQNKELAWEESYIRYGDLKKLLVQILEEGAPVSVPTAFSLTVGRPVGGAKPTPQEDFFRFLEEDVKRINDFTTAQAASLRSQLRDVAVSLGAASAAGALEAEPGVRARLLAAARGLGEEYLRLERYVNLNYAGLQKILKKHDKLVPSAPCWHFYKVHINRQPWVRGEHHDIQVTLSRIFSQLHAAAIAASAAAPAGEGGTPPNAAAGQPQQGPQPPQGASQAHAGPAGAHPLSGWHLPLHLAPYHHQHADFVKNTYWLRAEDAAQVRHVLMQHLVALPPPTNASAAGSSHHGRHRTQHQQHHPHEPRRRQHSDPQEHLTSAAQPEPLSPAGSSTGPSAIDGGGERDPGGEPGSSGSGCGGADLVNTIYLDNASLELYHNLLYGRPYACTLQLRWYGSHLPDTVDVIRQSHREGWRPEECTEDSFPIQETRVAEFLNGRWTWADARKLLMPEEGPGWRQGDGAPGQPGFTGGDAGGTSMAYEQQQRAERMGSHAAASSSAGAARGAGGRGSAGDVAQDPARLAQEYQMFKIFTEVARLVESKGLQPMVQVRFRRSAYREPGDEHGLTALLEADVQMLLEYAYDTRTRLAHGLWRQEHPADAIEFPYAILKVQHPAAWGASPAWLQGLEEQGLLRQMSDFSKFLHGCAGLLPDMVRAVPQWIDDEGVQRSLYANVVANEDLQALLRAGHNVMAEMEEGLLEEAAARNRQGTGGSITGSRTTAAVAAGGGSGGAPASAGSALSRTASLKSSKSLARSGGPDCSGGTGALSRDSRGAEMDGRAGGGGPPGRTASGRLVAASGGAAVDSGAGGSQAVDGAGGAVAEGACCGGGVARAGSEALPEDSPVLPLLHNLQRAVSERVGHAAAVSAGWQAKLLQRQALQGRAYRPQLMFVDPSQFLRNERIFLMWLRTAITVGGLATGMLGFAANAATNPAAETPTIHISEITSFVLLGLAIALAGYGTAAFVWRSTRLYELHAARFDDTSGTLAMTAVVTLSLFVLMFANMADLMEVLGDRADDDGLTGGDSGADSLGGVKGAQGYSNATSALMMSVGLLGRLGGAAWRLGGST